jgi:hypothetical protein
MGISVKWGDSEQTILLWTGESPWTWEELDAAYAELQRSLQSVYHSVDVLVDARNFGFVPKNMLSMTDTRYSIYPENMKSVVLIGAPSIIKAIIAVMRQMKPSTFSRFQFARNFDEAYQLVNASYH